MTPDEFIATIAAAAQKSAITSKIPASFTVAQAALESGWGGSVKGMNLFGIKADANWHGETIDIATHEVIKGVRVAITAKFRKYNSWLDSITDHAKFLTCNPRYKSAFACIECADFTRAIAAAGYATDPNYASIINGIVVRHNLGRLDA